MTHLLTLFLATFAAAFAATIPPGLLNMNAAKTSVQKGKRNGVTFSLGVCCTLMLQAYIAVHISKFLHNNPAVVEVLLKVALGLFALLAIYFAMAARRQKAETTPPVNLSKTNSFLKGMLLAALNLLTLPYYSGLNALWNKAGWMAFTTADTFTFVIAAGAGTFSVLYLYVFYFDKLETQTHRFAKNANAILAALMVVLWVVTLIRILYR